MPIISCGLAKGHRGNPVSGLRLERLYGTPVLLSGLSALTLSTGEYSAIHQKHKNTVRQILRLPVNTPESALMFLAGCLPATALIHLRMFSILGMVARLESDNILNQLGRQILLSDGRGKSWFLAVRTISAQYGVTDPLLILQTPPSKESWKRLTKHLVTKWWEEKYRGEAALLPSLKYLNLTTLSLNTPHMMWRCAGRQY